MEIELEQSPNIVIGNMMKLFVKMEERIHELEDHLVEHHNCNRPTVTDSYKLRTRAEIPSGDSQ